MMTKVEPRADGQDQTEALRAFRKDVEVMLDHLLESVPSGQSLTLASSSTVASPVSVAAPPAYNNAGVETMDEKTSK